MKNTDSFWYTTEYLFHSSRLFWKTPDTLIEFIADDEIIPATIVDLSQDCSGNLIASTHPFLNHLINDEWQTISLATNNQDCFFGRFVQDEFSCDAWIASSTMNWNEHCGSVWKLKAGALVEYDILPHKNLYIYRDNEGDILITSNNPAIIHKIDTLGNETILPVPGSRGITDIHLMGEEKMVALSFIDSIDQEQSIRIYENNEWSKLNLDSLGITDMSIGRDMYADGDGSLRINEKNGLIKYDGELLSYYPFDYPMRGMVEDSYGSLWISTADYGVIRWSPDTDSTIIYNTSNSEILSNACRELQIIDDHLWVNHYYGLTKIKIEPIEGTTQSQEVQRLQYKLYPNPSSGQFTITNPLNAFREIDIFTTDGIFVSSYSGNDIELSLTLGAGVYMVKLKQAHREIFEKVIIVD